MQKIICDGNIGSNLLRIRKEFNFTQAKLVEKMQLMGSVISVKTYSKIETGERDIKVTDLVIFKQVFQVSFDDIFKDIVI